MHDNPYPTLFMNLKRMVEYEKRKYDQKIPQSHTADHTRHREEDCNTPGRQSKATSSLFPIKMIAKLERTHSNVQQNMEQTQNPTMGAAINNKSTATEPPP